MSMRQTAGNIAAIAALAMTFLVAGWLLWRAYSPATPAVQTIGVYASDFEEATREAMDLINGWVGCEIFVEGRDVEVKSDDGEPCGDPWRPESEAGHSATAYQCIGGEPRWEILVSFPGDLHTQLCIVAHELGHVAGLVDGGRGIMNQHNCPEFVALTDAETKQLKEGFCQ